MPDARNVGVGVHRPQSQGRVPDADNLGFAARSTRTTLISKVYIVATPNVAEACVTADEGVAAGVAVVVITGAVAEEGVVAAGDVVEARPHAQERVVLTVDVVRARELADKDVFKATVLTASTLTHKGVGGAIRAQKSSLLAHKGVLEASGVRGASVDAYKNVLCAVNAQHGFAYDLVM